jgi:hypothetical protein
VLTFNRDNQQDFFALLGLSLWHGSQMLLAVGAVCAVLLGALAWWLRLPSRARHDAAQRLFARFCRRLEKAGMARAVSEPPLTFTERAAERFTNRAEEIRTIGSIYSDIRYGKSPPPVRELARSVRALGKLE